MTLVSLDTDTTGPDPGVRPAVDKLVSQVPMCEWRSPSSDDGYCRCILPVHQGPHRCMHAWLT